MEAFPNQFTPTAFSTPAVDADHVERMTICMFSADLDRLLAGFTIATGAAAVGKGVDVFFTFWATSALRSARPSHHKKRLILRMLGWMMPKGMPGLRISKLNMGGLGTLLLKREMRLKNVQPLEELFEQARDLGVRIHVCEMSMDLLGFTPDDLIDPELPVVGVCSYLEMASKAQVNLFI